MNIVSLIFPLLRCLEVAALNCDAVDGYNIKLNLIHQIYLTKILRICSEMNSLYEYTCYCSNTLYLHGKIKHLK